MAYAYDRVGDTRVTSIKRRGKPSQQRRSTRDWHSRCSDDGEVRESLRHLPRRALAATRERVPLAADAAGLAAVARETDAGVVVVAVLPRVGVGLGVAHAGVQLEVRVDVVLRAEPVLHEKLVPVLAGGQGAGALVDHGLVVAAAAGARALHEAAVRDKLGVEGVAVGRGGAPDERNYTR